MAYFFYKIVTRLFASMPWCVISFLSRFLSFVVVDLIAYRKKVVQENIDNCFPNLSEIERQKIVKDFYNHLVYSFLSSPKLLSLPKYQLKEKHLKVQNLDVFNVIKDHGSKHAIILMGHCGNWELFSAGQIYFDDLGLRQEQLYRPLKNKAFDQVQKEMRSHYGAISTPKSLIGRRMLELIRNENSPATIFAFIADQTPSQIKQGLWTNFLGRPTAFLDGAERLARKFNLPVFYLDITREQDAVYSADIKLISARPKDEDLHFITKTYIQLLEQTILRTPSDWLWSHKRWKLPYNENDAELI